MSDNKAVVVILDQLAAEYELAGLVASMDEKIAHLVWEIVYEAMLVCKHQQATS